MMTREEIAALAVEAGFHISNSGAEVKGFDTQLFEFAKLVSDREREARKAAQQETIALREELTKRAMKAEKDAYQRGVRDEREACAKLAAETICDRHILSGVKIYGSRVAKAIRDRSKPC